MWHGNWPTTNLADADLAQTGRFIFLRGNPYSGVAAYLSGLQ